MCRGLYRLNNTVLRCRLNAPNCISNRRSAGKLFHTRGQATEKLLSPKVLWVCGRKHVLSLAERWQYLPTTYRYVVGRDNSDNSLISSHHAAAGPHPITAVQGGGPLATSDVQSGHLPPGQPHPWGATSATRRWWCGWWCGVAARVVSGTWKFDSGLSTVRHSELHWLNVLSRSITSLALWYTDVSTENLCSTLQTYAHQTLILLLDSVYGQPVVISLSSYASDWALTADGPFLSPACLSGTHYRSSSGIRTLA